MRKRTSIVLLACATFAGVAQAQTVFHTLDWVEVHAGSANPVANPNGILEPGEAALLRVSVEFDPIGTVIKLPTISGTVAGLAQSIFAIEPQELAPGTWSNAAVAAGFFASISPPPQPHPSGHYRFAGAFQNGVWPWVPDPTNPIPLLWQAVWSPDSYQARNVEFDIDFSGGTFYSSNIHIHYGNDPVTGHPLFFPVEATPVVNNAIQIPIVPAPATGLVLLAGGMAFGRRRRHRS